MSRPAPTAGIRTTPTSPARASFSPLPAVLLFLAVATALLSGCAPSPSTPEPTPPSGAPTLASPPGTSGPAAPAPSDPVAPEVSGPQPGSQLSGSQLSGGPGGPPPRKVPTTLDAPTVLSEFTAAGLAVSNPKDASTRCRTEGCTRLFTSDTVTVAAFADARRAAQHTGTGYRRGSIVLTFPEGTPPDLRARYERELARLIP